MEVWGKDNEHIPGRNRLLSLGMGGKDGIGKDEAEGKPLGDGGGGRGQGLADGDGPGTWSPGV